MKRADWTLFGVAAVALLLGAATAPSGVWWLPFGYGVAVFGYYTYRTVRRLRII